MPGDSSQHSLQHLLGRAWIHGTTGFVRKSDDAIDRREIAGEIRRPKPIAHIVGNAGGTIDRRDHRHIVARPDPAIGTPVTGKCSLLPGWMERDGFGIDAEGVLTSKI